jgi:hypothetical protein
MTDEPSESDPSDPSEPSESDEPLEWTLQMSMDGAQRLIHAWKDGRLEQTLGFPIESLRIHTPFTPTGGGGPSEPPDDSRPITLLPWDGVKLAGIPIVLEPKGGPAGPRGGAPRGGAQPRAVVTPLPTAERSGSSTKKVAVASGLVIAAVLALWLTRPSSDSPPPQTSEPEAQEPSGAGSVPSTQASAGSAEGGAKDSVAPEPSPAATAEGTGFDVSEGSTGSATAEGTGSDVSEGSASAATDGDTGSTALAPPEEPSTTPRSGEGEARPGPAEGVASSGKAGATKPRKHGGGAKPTSKEDVAPKPPKDPTLYSHYRCATEGAEFEIVVHARSEAEAKAGTCGGSEAEARAACIGSTTCKRTN